MRAVTKDRDNMLRGRVSVYHKDYRAWPLDCGEPAAIYCDPPYAASSKAKRYAVGFRLGIVLGVGRGAVAAA